MEAAIRFSQNSLPNDPQRFLYVDVVGKSIRLCKTSSQFRKNLEYTTIYTSTKAPAFRAFDWHPVNEELVVVGQAGGDATLLNIAEGQQDALSFQVRSQRLCNAVALNTQNLLAAGLDKVRTDFCLNVWDFNQRLPAQGSKGFSKNYSDPLHKLASGEPITSLRFFQDNPSLLVAGVKGQFVRLYDLRESSHGNDLQFATRCVHNLAIDWLDENYFASCFPTKDPSISIWDRRMISRVNTPHMTISHDENRQPDASLELKTTLQAPGTIWSLRFSKTERGCLGVLFSTGHVKVYNIGREFSNFTEAEQNGGHGKSWETALPESVFLDRTQDIGGQLPDPSTPKEEKARIASFDFLANTTKNSQSRIAVLNSHGHIKLTSPTLPPPPAVLSARAYLCMSVGTIEPSLTTCELPSLALDQIRGQARSRNTLKQNLRQSRKAKNAVGGKRMSRLDDQAWHADLGFYETDVPLRDRLVLASSQRLRCEAGYLMEPSQNKNIVSDSPWLQSFWAWTERAGRISRNGNMTQDNIDLSFIGVYGFWMEDVDLKSRTLGTRSTPIGKSIENLVRRLNIASNSSVDTEYVANRQLCLHSAGLAWSSEELENMTKQLVSNNQHTKAAALALFATNRKLAYKALRDKTATQSHKMLAMAIAAAVKRTKSGEGAFTTGDESDEEDDWTATISSLVDELTDPYARAILAYVKTGDWASVVAEDSLPLKYRVCVALRHYDDSRLTRYIAQATKDAISEGDLEGVVLTGTATQAFFDLASNYIRRFSDLQTAVLALCPAVPRYLNDVNLVRKFTAWTVAYKHMMNSWNLRFHRVKFDIAYQRIARDEVDRPLIHPAKQQIRLVCQYCSQSLAHEAGLSHETSPGNKTVATSRHPLSKEKAAAIGTVCPKCERHLPRCGVCDMWLGTPDASYLPWYGAQKSDTREVGKSSIDLSASIAGSIQTTLGPETPARTGMKASNSPRQKVSPQALSKSSATDSSTKTAIPSTTSANKRADSVPGIVLEQPPNTPAEPTSGNKNAEAAQKWDAAMSQFTVLCVKCMHGFHAIHARMWFEKHQVCPVPECRCLCSG